MTHLVFGGSASGKSLFAEDIVMKISGSRVYLATMRPWDEECVKRIEKHRKQRKNKGFDTIECYGSLVDITTDENATILLECMGNLVANVQFSDHPPADIAGQICREIDGLAEKCENLIVVSNDIFLEEPPENKETMEYLQLLARINQHMACRFDLVTEVVCGIPVDLKGGVLRC